MTGAKFSIAPSRKAEELFNFPDDILTAQSYEGACEVALQKFTEGYYKKFT